MIFLALSHYLATWLEPISYHFTISNTFLKSQAIMNQCHLSNSQHILVMLKYTATERGILARASIRPYSANLIVHIAQSKHAWLSRTLNAHLGNKWFIILGLTNPKEKFKWEKSK